MEENSEIVTPKKRKKRTLTGDHKEKLRAAKISTDEIKANVRKFVEDFSIIDTDLKRNDFLKARRKSIEHVNFTQTLTALQVEYAQNAKRSLETVDSKYVANKKSNHQINSMVKHISEGVDDKMVKYFQSIFCFF
jgi:hypothetical protein